MKKYLVEITETLQKQITITANSREEAEQKVKEMKQTLCWRILNMN